MSKGKDYRFLKSPSNLLAGAGLLQGDDDKLERGVEYSFLTGIVNEVISNPYDFMRKPVGVDGTITLGEMLSGRKNVKGSGESLSNKDLVETAPMNSIIAQIIDPGRASKDGELPVLCYPFFPPHLSLPLKPGEYVWLIECDVKGSKMYYWMCRQVGTIHVDDLNYTNMERLLKTSNIFNTFVKNEGAKAPNTEELDKALSLDGGENSTNTNKKFSKIFENSNAYRSEFTGEPVPRLAKDCGDLLLQGSNNTGIHFTTEKFSEAEDTDVTNKKYTGKIREDDSLPARKPDSSAIDIFVKRKKEDLDKLVELLDETEQYDTINTVKNNCANDVYTYIENDKLAALRYQDDSVFDRELIDDKSDAVNVGARVYLSHKCDVDNTFLINLDSLETKMGPSIITFSEHNRIIGNQDVRLVSRSGQSFVDLDEKGNINIKSIKNQGKLSIGDDGISRLQSNQKIELTAGGDAGAPNEAYVLNTKLQTLLTNIYTILLAHNTAITALAPIKFPPLIPAGTQVATTMNDQTSDKLISMVTDITKIASTKIFGE